MYYKNRIKKITITQSKICWGPYCCTDNERIVQFWLYTIEAKKYFTSGRFNVCSYSPGDHFTKEMTDESVVRNIRTILNPLVPRWRCSARVVKKKKKTTNFMTNEAGDSIGIIWTTIGRTGRTKLFEIE